jgi:hypothetical protein
MYSPFLLGGASLDIIICHIVVQTNLPNRIIMVEGRDVPLGFQEDVAMSEEFNCILLA